MTSHPSALLIEAPVGRHFAQIHRDPALRADSVALFIEAGLRRGRSVVAIVAKANVDEYLDRIRARGLDPVSYRRSGAFELLQAETMLEHVMHDGKPDWTAFSNLVGGLIARARARNHGGTCAYGEMVGMLWEQEQYEAASRLEQYWNDLARTHPFSLFCTYRLDFRDPGGYCGPLHEIGHCHTDIVATNEDERFREALDAASREVFGVPLAELISLSHAADRPGEERLPAGQRTMLWIMRNLPWSSARVFALARRRLERRPALA